MCICKIEEMLAGLSPHQRRESAGEQRAAVAMAATVRKADRHQAKGAVLTSCLISFPFLVHDHSTAVVAVLTTLTLTLLLGQQTLGADRLSGRRRHD